MVVLPNRSPSSVTAFASGPRPATEKDEAVESVPPSGSTPATSPTSDARSVGSTGSCASWSGLKARSWEPGVGASPPRRFCCAVTSIPSSCTGLPRSWTFQTRRSSSASRWTSWMRGVMPSTRTLIRYCPPPSVNRMVKRPRASVRARRVTCVSSEKASIVASGIGVPSSEVMTPVMMSVPWPTWAAARAGARRPSAPRNRKSGSNRRRIMDGTGITGRSRVISIYGAEVDCAERPALTLPRPPRRRFAGDSTERAAARIVLEKLRRSTAPQAVHSSLRDPMRRVAFAPVLLVALHLRTLRRVERSGTVPPAAPGRGGHPRRAAAAADAW